MRSYLRQSADTWAQLPDLPRDMADLPPADRDEDGEPTGPWAGIDYAASDAAIAEAARRIEAFNAARAAAVLELAS